MIRIPIGRTPRYCDGMSRRSFVQVGLAGLGAVGLGDVLRAKAAAAGARKDTSLILIWLDGGPSHHDTYDPKPNAPSEYRGIWRHIPTNVSGMDVCELFPLQSKIGHLYSILRSVHHDTGDHFTGGHWMLTGRGGVSGGNTAQQFPFFGSIAGKVLGARKPGMPAVVGVPYAMSIGLRPGYFGANYLGVENNPFETNGDPNADNFQVTNLSPVGGLTLERLNDRHALNGTLDQARRRLEKTGLADAIDEFDQQAFDLVTGSQAREAFNIAAESPEMRERYGRSSWGQSVLLARRLVEAGSTVVTCHFGGWDTHWNHQSAMESYLPRVDRAIHGLLTDLDERGILDKTMVMVCGEFSRTPRMNDGGNGGPPLSKGTPGRDHWGAALSVMVAGGGLKGGQVVGATNRLGERPAERPLRPGDVHHTIYHVLGMNPETAFLNPAGRPVPAIDHGELIREVV